MTVPHGVDFEALMLVTLDATAKKVAVMTAIKGQFVAAGWDARMAEYATVEMVCSGEAQ